MALSEFQLIQSYFSRAAEGRRDVLLGVGDDAALLSAAAGCELVMSIDTLVAGVHFPVDTAPEDIGHKALAVNLSDMAAMGAEPSWVMLALTLPEVDEAWLEGFCRGFYELAQCHNVALIGGDTTRGPLSISVQITGQAAQGRALRRSGARPGDLVYVSGELGLAGVGLQAQLGQADFPQLPDKLLNRCRERLNRPLPQVALGRALLDYATAAIDISDGLAADLGHILEMSGVGAVIDVAEIPLADELKDVLPSPWYQLPLTAGDDYELCFTIPLAKKAAFDKLCSVTRFDCRCIGRITDEAGLRLVEENGPLEWCHKTGFQHFE